MVTVVDLGTFEEDDQYLFYVKETTSGNFLNFMGDANIFLVFDKHGETISKNNPFQTPPRESSSCIRCDKVSQSQDIEHQDWERVKCVEPNGTVYHVKNHAKKILEMEDERGKPDPNIQYYSICPDCQDTVTSRARSLSKDLPAEVASRVI